LHLILASKTPSSYSERYDLLNVTQDVDPWMTQGNVPTNVKKRIRTDIPVYRASERKFVQTWWNELIPILEAEKPTNMIVSRYNKATIGVRMPGVI
jgi:hypothetical protein